MFTDCLSFTAVDTVPPCYSQVVELVNPGFGAKGRLLEPRLQFRRQFQKRVSLVDNGCKIVSEVFGEPFADPFWAMVQGSKF